jgi:hypothetical protein
VCVSVCLCLCLSHPGELGRERKSQMQAVLSPLLDLSPCGFGV